jgi:hypothetical protein
VNATSILWAVTGGTILTGQGTSSITVSYPSTAVNGSVSAQAVSNCGVSTVRTIAARLAACAVVPPPPPPPFAATGNEQLKGATAAADAMKVNVYPNPTTTDFKLQVITAGKEEISVRVLDMAGRFYKQLTIMPNQTINLGAELKAGSYMIEVKQGALIRTIRVLKF